MPPQVVTRSTKVPPHNSRDGTLPQDMLGQPVECEPPTQGTNLIPARQVNKFTPISPTKHKSSDGVIILYKDYKNTKDIGKLAIALTKYTYSDRA